MNSHAQRRRRQITGLPIIAVIILLVALYRVDLNAIFPPGWWRF